MAPHQLPPIASATTFRCVPRPRVPSCSVRMFGNDSSLNANTPSRNAGFGHSSPLRCKQSLRSFGLHPAREGNLHLSHDNKVYIHAFLRVSHDTTERSPTTGTLSEMPYCRLGGNKMMSNQKFIPELHDIGKLVDEKVKDEVNIKVLGGQKCKYGYAFMLRG